MENPYATYRNGHQLVNTFNPEDNTLDIRSNALWPANVLSNLWEKPFVFEDGETGERNGAAISNCSTGSVFDTRRFP